MITLFIVIAVIIVMLLLWTLLSNAGVQFTDTLGYVLFFSALIIVVLPIVLLMLKGSGKKK